MIAMNVRSRLVDVRKGFVEERRFSAAYEARKNAGFSP